MNKSKFFGARPVFYFAEPAAVGGDGAAPAGGGDAGGGSGGAGSESGGTDFSKLSDTEALESTLDKPAATESAEPAAKEAPPAKELGKETEEINLSLLDESQPEWLAKVADAGAKAEIQKLLDFQKAVNSRFKDAAELENFFKELPGGTEQVAALQTLSREVGELDGHIAANTPEGNATVVGRYLGEAPDGGVGLFRAGAQHLAKTNPEAWREIGTELNDASLKAHGFPVGIGRLAEVRDEIRAAVAADDGERVGRALEELLGAPKAESKVDPTIARAREAEQSARTAERAAKVEVWDGKRQAAKGSTEQHLKQAIGTALAAKDSQNRPLIPASIPQAKREELTQRIFKEVDDQIGADAWTISQIKMLIGTAQGDKQNLAATKEHFAQAVKLYNDAAGRLLGAAVKKHVTAWATEVVTASQEAIDRAKGGAPRKDVGGNAPASRGPKRLSTDDVVGPNAKDDKQILEMTVGL